MLRIISSKNESEIYSLSKKEKIKAKFASNFLDCSLEEAESRAQDVSIFGDLESFMIRVNRKEEIEDLIDGLIAESRKGEPTISLSMVKKELKKRGVL